mmetsp:Transcript_12077/g.17359  ORF Transcript_12077/g.17359 Transcript_12077/m.17359 type:complete len:122 (-) Transcript_12077:31-396(-)
MEDDVEVAEDGIVGDIEELVHAVGQEEMDGLGVDDFCKTNWKDDKWWRTVMNERSGVIPNFCKAVRLVVLSQASSAAVERVFSQLTFIRRVVGDNTVRDMLELRAFMRCNNDLVDDYNVKK